jgi:hypothetical protein
MPELGFFRKYCEYIQNTSYGTEEKPLPKEFFYDDWEPIGPQVHRDLKDAGLVVDRCDDPRGIVLTEKGRELANAVS